MRIWKTTIAIAAIGLLFASEASAQQRLRHRMDGQGYCLSMPEITNSFGSYTARWSNGCDMGIWIDYTRLNDSGETVSGDVYVSANSTGSTDLHRADRLISWQERR